MVEGASVPLIQQPQEIVLVVVFHRFSPMFGVFFEGDGFSEEDRFISTWKTEAEAGAAAAEATAMHPQGKYCVMPVVWRSAGDGRFELLPAVSETCPF